MGKPTTPKPTTPKPTTPKPTTPKPTTPKPTTPKATPKPTTPKATPKATTTQTKFEFVQFPVGKSCLPKGGYMDVPISGKRDNLAHCEELCSKDVRCRSFTFFRN